MNRRLPPAIAAALYLALALSFLAFGFPHEDAFILFKYANNVACGQGIAFYPGGPHVEGATDFLWMMALAGAHLLHVDVAVAAAVLNAVGFGLAASILWNARPNRSARAKAVRVVAVVLLFGTSAAFASLRGFSAMLYSALALFILTRLVAPSAKKVTSVPLLALLLALVRPDGVILGAGLSFVAFLRARKVGKTAEFGARAGIAVVIGAAYFVWRWRYFGSLLPLPLYVKAHYRGWPPGLEVTFDWCLSTLVPLSVVALFGRLVLGKVRARERKRLGALGVALLPFALHVASFIPSVPSQNVVNRFEAPATLALFFFVVQTLAARRVAERTPAKVALVLAALAVAFAPMLRLDAFEVADAFHGNYPNVLSRDIGTLTTPHTRIAATEAGRVLYYARGPVVDLVGLDTKETALTPPQGTFLAAFDPDVVMLHHAGSLDESTIADDDVDVIQIREPLREHAFRPVLPFFDERLPPYDVLKIENVFVAATATEAFLDAHRDAYDVYAVRFKSRFFHFHVYAIKKDWPEKGALLRAIEKAHREAFVHSYLEFSPAFGTTCPR
ncbi:MAG: hypothetical protein ABI551_13210 [Polyangiaceae bacterium]